jgi:8-oxo-dGTP pyrophosphatase MutT (NUDIX family)
MPPDVERIRRVLLPLELAESELRAKPAAAVLVLLRLQGNGVEALLARRVRRADDPWSGQISFPGGRQHEGDGSLLATATRETKEEVNVDLEGRVEILGHMAPRSPGNVPELLVVPFVGFVTGEIDPSPGPEMEEVFWTPLEELPPCWGRTIVTTRIGELHVPAFLWRERVIWGFTYRVLEDLLALLGISRSAGPGP